MPIDLQNPWFSLSNSNPTNPTDPAGNPNNTTNPGGNPYFNGPGQPTWGSSTPWGTGTKDAAMRKFFDPKNYASWDRDQWRSVIQESTGQGPGSILSELTGLIGQDGVNRHIQHFGAGGNGYLPGKFDWTSGKMGYQGYDPSLVAQANNSPWSGGGPQVVNYNAQNQATNFEGHNTNGTSLGNTGAGTSGGLPPGYGGGPALGNLYNPGRSVPTGFTAPGAPPQGAGATPPIMGGTSMARAPRSPYQFSGTVGSGTIPGPYQPLSETGQNTNQNRIVRNPRQPYYYQPVT